MWCHALYCILQVDPGDPWSTYSTADIQDAATSTSHCMATGPLLQSWSESSTGWKHLQKQFPQRKTKKIWRKFANCEGQKGQRSEFRICMNFRHPTSRSNSATRCGKRRAWTGASLVSQHFSPHKFSWEILTDRYTLHHFAIHRGCTGIHVPCLGLSWFVHVFELWKSLRHQHLDGSGWDQPAFWSSINFIGFYIYVPTWSAWPCHPKQYEIW